MRPCPAVIRCYVNRLLSTIYIQVNSLLVKLDSRVSSGLRYRHVGYLATSGSYLQCSCQFLDRDVGRYVRDRDAPNELASGSGIVGDNRSVSRSLSSRRVVSREP